ncbi:MAG: hypothetical protein J1F11_06390 [Oscillospiraceae bacterium]|nr:hypothetical protein [Oscillospiraceae bacterium]
MVINSKFPELYRSLPDISTADPAADNADKYGVRIRSGYCSTEVSEVMDILDKFVSHPLSDFDYAHIRLPYSKLRSHIGCLTPDEEYADIGDYLIGEDFYFRKYKGEKYFPAYRNKVKYQEFQFIRGFWLFLDKYKETDFKELMGIKIFSLMKMQQQMNPRKDKLPAVYWSSGKIVSDTTATIGDLFESLAPWFNEWDLSRESIEKYEQNVYKACFSFQSVMSVLANSVFYVDLRLSYYRNISVSSCHDKDKIRKILDEEKRTRKELIQNNLPSAENS